MKKIIMFSELRKNISSDFDFFNQGQKSNGIAAHNDAYIEFLNSSQMWYLKTNLKINKTKHRYLELRKV